MQNFDETESNSSTVPPTESQEKNNQVENVDQNQSVHDQIGAESILESFAPGSSSDSYTPSDMATGETLLENAMKGDQSTLSNSVVTLLREQIEENKNLRVSLADLEAAIADYQQQLVESEQKNSQISAEKSDLQQELIDSTSKFESTIRNLKNQLRDESKDSSTKIKNLEDAQQKSLKLWDQEKSELLKKISNLESFMKGKRENDDTQVKKLERKPLPTKFR